MNVYDAIENGTAPSHSQIRKLLEGGYKRVVLNTMRELRSLPLRIEVIFSIGDKTYSMLVYVTQTKNGYEMVPQKFAFFNSHYVERSFTTPRLISVTEKT